jgi:serine/threonine-protein kinase RsbW
MLDQKEYQRIFIARLADLPEMLDWLRKIIKKIKFSPLEAQQIEVAAEEALVNIIHHGYAEGEIGNIDLSIKIFPEDTIEIILKDQGKPFNPLLQDITINHNLSLEQRSVGGLGLFFMSMYMDDLYYHREGKTNVLIMIKTKASSA